MALIYNVHFGLAVEHTACSLCYKEGIWWIKGYGATYCTHHLLSRRFDYAIWWTENAKYTFKNGSNI